MDMEEDKEGGKTGKGTSEFDDLEIQLSGEVIVDEDQLRVRRVKQSTGYMR